MMKGLLLGLASGANCLAACAPMLLSLLAAEAGSGRSGFGLVGFFLLGGAGAYPALGLLAWCFGSAAQRWPAWHSLLLGAALMAFSVLRLRYGFGSGPRPGGGRLPACVNQHSYRTPSLAVIGGLVTGLNPCAPVLLAFTAAAESRTLFESLVFFLGTSVYPVPLPLLGFLGRWNRLRLVARLAVGLMGAF